VRFQIKRLVRVHFFYASILRLAAVAHQRVADDRVESDIDQRGGEQDAESPKDVGIVPSNRTTDDADDDQPDAETLRKIFADEQIGAGADEAAFDTVAFDGPLVDGDFGLAVRAVEFGGIGVEMDADPFLAGRASVGDVHGVVGSWWLVVGSRVATQRKGNQNRLSRALRCVATRLTAHDYSGNSDSVESSKAIVSPTKVPITAT